MDKLFFIGLGNPGSQYDGTRHNIGFDVVDSLAGALKIRFKPGTGEYLEARGFFGDTEVGLAKPLTYMNNSGSAVMEIQERYHLPLDRLLIICDDFWLPLGTLRLRTKGSDGGHNGLYSIIYHLQ
ncbi:MAG: aminoacyl-tRNA hydrolase, partial [Bacteroidota bacterium]